MKRLMQTMFMLLPECSWKEMLLLKQILGDSLVSLQISEMIIELLVEAIPVYSIRIEYERQLSDVSILLLYLFNVEEIVL